MRLCYRVVLLMFIMVSPSCKIKNTVKKHDCSLYQANKLVTDYLISRDTAVLAKSYECLTSNEEFREFGITKRNYDLVFSVLMYSRKYDELEHLISNMDFNVDGQELIMNMIKALQIYNEDQLEAYKYINKNIDIIRGRIDSNPLDSTLYSQYFMMRLYLSGREKCLVELDSFKSANRNFTDVFYEHVLRDLIEEYPSEYLFP